MIPRSIAKSMTGIEWTDFSANPWTVCTEIPAAPGARSGCEICYARGFAKRLGLEWGARVPRHRFAGFAARVRRLERVAAATGLPFAVFTLSLGDWLDAEVAPAWRAELVDEIEAAPHLTWLILTHRPHLVAKLAPARWRARLPANVWPGVTVDHPAHARRWDQLAEHWGDTGRAWVSAEPLLGRLTSPFAGAAAIVAGGASGTSDPTLALDRGDVEALIEQHGERVFFKQWGAFRDGRQMTKAAAGRDLDGRLYDKTPWPRHRDQLRAAAA